MFRDEKYFHAMSEIRNPHLDYILSVLAGEISDINFSIKNNKSKENADLRIEIENLKNEISTIKKVLEYLGVEYKKNGIFIIKEQPKRNF